MLYIAIAVGMIGLALIVIDFVEWYKDLNSWDDFSWDLTDEDLKK